MFHHHQDSIHQNNEPKPITEPGLLTDSLHDRYKP